MDRADVKKYRWALLAGEVEFNRFVERVTRRHRIGFKQLVWIARNLCDREILCDHLGLRVAGRLPARGGDRSPVKAGTARVVDQICTCGLRCSLLCGVDDPENIRTIDDTIGFLSTPHTPEQHRRDLNGIKYSFVDPVRTLTKVTVLEVIEPGDPRYRNHLRWVRGIAHGKMMFVLAFGLKNTVSFREGCLNHSGSSGSLAVLVEEDRDGRTRPRGIAVGSGARTGPVPGLARAA
jgi:hypothetical protein